MIGTATASIAELIAENEALRAANAKLSQRVFVAQAANSELNQRVLVVQATNAKLKNRILKAQATIADLNVRALKAEELYRQIEAERANQAQAPTRSESAARITRTRKLDWRRSR